MVEINDIIYEFLVDLGWVKINSEDFVKYKPIWGESVIVMFRMLFGEETIFKHHDKLIIFACDEKPYFGTNELIFKIYDTNENCIYRSLFLDFHNYDFLDILGEWIDSNG